MTVPADVDSTRVLTHRLDALRAERAEVPRLLDLHREILDRYEPAR